MSQLSEQLDAFLAKEQTRNLHIYKIKVLLPCSGKLSGAGHDQIETWVNEGGAGGEDDGQPVSVVLAAQR